MTTRSKGTGLQASRKDTNSTPGEPYKSPQYKLVQFFDKSRRQGKAKCRAAKATIKVRKKRIGVLEESKERWQRRARAREEEVARLPAPGRAASREGQALKKNSA